MVGWNVWYCLVPGRGNLKYIKVTLEDADVSKLRAEIDKVGFINNDNDWLQQRIIDRIPSFPGIVTLHVDKVGEVVGIAYTDKKVIERQAQDMEKENESN